MPVQIFSPAQCVGYLAFVLGVYGFSQKQDRRLKLLVGFECLAYTVHFALLGNLPASASASISAVRSFLAVKLRSRFLAVFFVLLNVAIGIRLVHTPAGWLPIVASSSGAIAVFVLRGVPMRLLLLGSTLCWLANNILSHSIGGTMLESMIATVNLVTMLRLLLQRAAAPETEASRT